MDKKPKASRAKKKAAPKKKTPDEKQFERFVKTARELGVDESGKRFERTFDAIIEKKPQNRSG